MLLDSFNFPFAKGQIVTAEKINKEMKKEIKKELN